MERRPRAALALAVTFDILLAVVGTAAACVSLSSHDTVSALVAGGVALVGALRFVLDASEPS